MNCEACGHANEEHARFCAGCGALLPAPQDAADPLIGQIIGGRYRITRVLGEGGMGIVYEGEQQMGSTVRKVAVKTLHAHLSKDPSVLARFHRECGTVAQLEHPNTIKFYDFGSTADGTLYIAMEFVKGSPLNEVIEQGGAVAPERVVKVMKQICGALDEAHNLGIVHRDLKPENVILTVRAGEQDFVKVLDFGIAARSESADAQKEQKLTQQGMVLGTPPYMSPEQFTGKALDARSDIYSLGVMSYEMLTGRLPFDADTPWQWATQHMTAQPLPFEASPSSTSVPPEMRKAILRALSKEREARHETAKAFYADLSGGGGLTVEAPPAAAGGGSESTAAMAAVPDFGHGGAPPPMAQMQPVPAPAMPMAHAAQAAHVPPPPARDSGGGGKGLIVGLGAVGAVLLVGIIVVAARSMKPAEEETLTNPFSSAASSGTTVVGPTLEDPVASADPPSGSAGASATAGSGSPASTATKTPSASTGTTATGTASTATPTRPTSTATSSGPSGAAACDACIAAARGGNIQGAAANFGRCSDAAKKSQCQRFAGTMAPGAVQTAVLNGNCAQAKSIAAAASAMGAGSRVNLGKCR